MSKPIKILKGKMARLEIYEDRAELHRGMMGRFTTGGPSNKTFIYSKLSAIEFKKPGITSGYLQFVGSGLKAKSGTFNAAKNENSILFTTKTKQWKEAADFINDKIAEGDKKSIVQQVSSADEIAKFKDLADKGIITQEEFESKKKELLGL
jgi:hypothetical protein